MGNSKQPKKKKATKPAPRQIRLPEMRINPKALRADAVSPGALPEIIPDMFIDLRAAREEFEGDDRLLP